MNTYLITTMLPDRVGLLSQITGAIFQQGGNLTDLRQMIIGGVFSLSCLAEFQDGASVETIRQAIIKSLGDANAQVCLLACEANGLQKNVVQGERYVAAVSGPDRPGRVHLIAEIFAAHGVNVEGWRHDLSDPEHALTIGIVRVPVGVEVIRIQHELLEKLVPEGLMVSFRHENIFRATNEVGPIHALMETMEEEFTAC